MRRTYYSSLFILAVFILASSCNQSHKLTLASSGKSKYQIVVPDQPDPNVQKAANELQTYIRSMTGAQLPVRKNEEKQQKPSIYIGNFKEVNVLQPNEIHLLIIDNDVHIRGGTTKDVLNATYTFLEEVLGCRFYAPDGEYVPESPTLSIPVDLQMNYLPAVRTRTVHSRLFYDHPDFADKRKVTHEGFPGYIPGARVHTFHRFLPESVYYRDHPEYYALRDGKRLPTQLCLTNDDVLDIVTDSVAALIKRYPDRDAISVSQNDNVLYCQCEPCSALNDLEKSPAGSIIDFVNKVAEVFPDKTISTLAYQYSRQAPAYLKPADNVLITLCSIECDRSAPIEEKCAEFAQDLEDWAGKTENIRIWDYTTQFTNFLAPFPNLRTLQPNIQLFTKNNARWIFEQHSNQPSELFELRSYLTAKLLWNPDLNVDSVMHDFLLGYYQEAGPFVEKYVQTIHDELAADPDYFLFLYGDPSEAFGSYLRPELLLKYDQWFDDAEEAVEDKHKVLVRVKRARLGVDYAILEASRQQDSPEFMLTKKKEDGTMMTSPVLSKRLDKFRQVTAASGITMMNEMRYSVDEYLQSYQATIDRAMKPNLAFHKQVTLLEKPKKYAGENPQVLTDGAFGGANFYSNWLGFEGNNLEAIIDLEEVKDVSAISAAFLQVTNHLVFFPEQVSFYASQDGNQFRRLGVKQNQSPLMRTSKVNDVQNFTLTFPAVNARFIKVTANNAGKAPYWHHGAGLPAWIFVDEVMVR